MDRRSFLIALGVEPPVVVVAAGDPNRSRRDTDEYTRRRPDRRIRTVRLEES
jgi:hypothetical protein